MQGFASTPKGLVTSDIARVQRTLWLKRGLLLAEAVLLLAIVTVFLHTVNVYEDEVQNLTRLQQSAEATYPVTCDSANPLVAQNRHTNCQQLNLDRQMNPHFRAVERTAVHMLQHFNIFRWFNITADHTLGYLLIKFLDFVLSLTTFFAPFLVLAGCVVLYTWWSSRQTSLTLKSLREHLTNQAEEIGARGWFTPGAQRAQKAPPASRVDVNPYGPACPDVGQLRQRQTQPPAYQGYSTVQL